MKQITRIIRSTFAATCALLFASCASYKPQGSAGQLAHIRGSENMTLASGKYPGELVSPVKIDGLPFVWDGSTSSGRVHGIDPGKHRIRVMYTRVHLGQLMMGLRQFTVGEIEANFKPAGNYQVRARRINQGTDGTMSAVVEMWIEEVGSGQQIALPVSVSVFEENSKIPGGSTARLTY